MRGLPVNLPGAFLYSFSADSHPLKVLTASFRIRWAVCMGSPPKKSGFLFARMTASSARYDRTLPAFMSGYTSFMTAISQKTAFSFSDRSSLSQPVKTWRIRNSAAL